MRSLKKINISNRRGYLGKWLELSTWGGERYYCVGVGDNFIYLWYDGEYDDFGKNIYQYSIDDRWFKFDSCGINNSSRYTSWEEVRSFKDINFINYNFSDDNNISN